MNETTTVIAGLQEAEALRFSMLFSMAAVIMVLILAIFLIISLVKIRKLNKKYSVFMKGANGRDLEASILTRFNDIDKMKSDIEFIFGKLNIACDVLLTTYQKMSIVKYDAFKEMGGKLSFSMAMLDDKNNGYILTSVHTREGCYTYIKEIIKGESFVVLSEEERRALDEAKNKKNYMA